MTFISPSILWGNGGETYLDTMKAEPWAGVAQWVACLSSIYEAWLYSPPSLHKPVVVAHIREGDAGESGSYTEEKTIQ